MPMPPCWKAPQRCPRLRSWRGSNGTSLQMPSRGEFELSWDSSLQVPKALQAGICCVSFQKHFPKHQVFRLVEASPTKISRRDLAGQGSADTPEDDISGCQERIFFHRLVGRLPGGMAVRRCLEGRNAGTRGPPSGEGQPPPPCC